MKSRTERCRTAVHRVAICRPPLQFLDHGVCVFGDDDDEREHCQEDETALQELIKRKTKDIEPDIAFKDGVHKSEGLTVAKAEISVPLSIEDKRKEQRDCSRDKCHGSRQRGGEIGTPRFDDISKEPGCLRRSVFN